MYTVYVESPGCMRRSRIGEKATVSQGLTSKRNEAGGRQTVRHLTWCQRVKASALTTLFQACLSLGQRREVERVRQRQQQSGHLVITVLSQSAWHCSQGFVVRLE